MRKIKLKKNEKVKAVYLNGLLQELGKTGDYIIDNKGITFKHDIPNSDKPIVVTLDITKVISVK